MEDVNRVTVRWHDGYMEEFDAKPFMDELNANGLPWEIIEMPC